MSGSRSRAIIVLLLTFAAGLAAGVAADRLGLVPEAARAEVAEGEKEADRRGPHRGETTIERFADDLGLTATQRAEIEEVLERYHASMRSIWRDVRPRYRSVMDSVRAEIETVLTPEQVQAYRQLLQEREDEWKAKRRDGTWNPDG